MITLVMTLSICFQFIAAFMALRLIRISGVITAWTFIACALLIMATRRLVAFIHILSNNTGWDLPVELLGLVISILMLSGICFIKPLFERIKRIQQELIEKQAELVEINRTLEERVSSEVRINLEKDRIMMIQAREASMGEMVGNIAHQWKQPLNNLSLIIQGMQMSSECREMTSEQVEKATRTSLEIIHHMSRTIDDFRNFFAPHKLSQRFSVANEVEHAMTFVSASFEKHGIKAVCTVEQDSELHGPSNELAQVLLNVIQNAQEEMLERRVPEPLVRIEIFRDGDRAVVGVLDNAGGIPPEIIDRIFDPYFSSREGGSGIGLYMSKNIIEKKFNGRITASNRGIGAEFRIEVPATKGTR